MKHFTIDNQKNYHKTIRTGAAILCAASLLCSCTQTHGTTDEALLDSHPSAIETTQETPEATQVVQTGATITDPAETVDMSEVMEEASIQHLGYTGEIAGYSFRECNETQIFGDYSISWADYDGETYQMLSYNGVALLAKEDGSDAKLFYQEQRLDLPFSCNFEMDYEFMTLQDGDFMGTGGRQLALIIPVATGSGIDVDELYIIDLDHMVLADSYTQKDSYQEDIYKLFEEHFAQTGMSHPYTLFNYVQYSIHDGLIFVEYGACDDDYFYISFLEGSLLYEDGTFLLNPAMSFMDEEY